MKLQARYNRITIITTILILLVAAGGYYFILRYVLTKQEDDALKVEEVEIYDHIRKLDALPPASVYKDQRTSFTPVDQPGFRKFTTENFHNEATGSSEMIRKIEFPVQVKGHYYMATVSKSTEETESLVWLILFSTLALIVLLMIILFFTNRFLIKKLWQPFHTTLSSIKTFDISAPSTIKMEPTAITEFRELNENIRVMTKKVMADYQSLRNFTDHASHEIQTPLAVINSKLDMLIQEPELSEQSMDLIQSMYKAVEKLSRLIQSLLLLTRIENNQYSRTENISIDNIIEEKLDELQEPAISSQLSFEKLLTPLTVVMNRELAEVLVGNLIRNAVMHSRSGDTIKLDLHEGKLVVCNSGSKALDQTRIFERFYKSDSSSGKGLGLAIVKQICEQYKFRIAYSFEMNKHCFLVDFKG